MSSDLTTSGGPAVNLNCGPDNPPSNTIQSENSSQHSAVPVNPEVQSEMSETKKVENIDEKTTNAGEKMMEPQSIISSPEINKESAEICPESETNVIQESTPVASDSDKNISEKIEQPQTEPEKPKIEENAEKIKTSSPNEAQVVEEKPADNNTNSSAMKEMEQNKNKESNTNVEEEPVFLDAQEISEQIMNILNDSKSEILATPQELWKKNVELQEFILKLIQVLKEKTNLCANLERQNTALISQAQSLKDVISITKDLLGIRNMEVEHLHADMTSMENRIKEERVRHNTAVARLNEAMQLNDKLKKEYLVQMDLFQKLREKYNEKVVVLTKENQRLNEIVKNNSMEIPAVPEASVENSNTENGVTPEEHCEENVDK